MFEFHSTRGGDNRSSFKDVVLAGLASDGGLYVPKVWPQLSAIPAEASYTDVAAAVIGAFTAGSIPPETLARIIRESYAPSVFMAADVVPLRPIGDQLYLMELFHGPTLAFKDVALQFLGRLFDAILEQSGEKLTIVGATSGDTGSAAIEACRGRKNISITILHPKGRTSEIQRRQMTTVIDDNVHNIAVEGTFDDCQALVKMAFADTDLQRRKTLSAVNSINWARIIAQTVYYVDAVRRLGQTAAFAVPTGNFGNVYAAWAGKRMGVPIGPLVIGSNRNDILTRFFETGAMTLDHVVPSFSPSMDIQISSNFERFLFDLTGENSSELNRMMTEFRTNRSFSVSPPQLDDARRQFIARRCSDDDTLATIRRTFEDCGEIIDPHTAVGLHALQNSALNFDGPRVALACAHPAKFPDVVERAIGVRPQLPAHLGDLMERLERYTTIPNSYDALKQHLLSA